MKCELSINQWKIVRCWTKLSDVNQLNIWQIVRCFQKIFTNTEGFHWNHIWWKYHALSKMLCLTVESPLKGHILSKIPILIYELCKETLVSYIITKIQSHLTKISLTFSQNWMICAWLRHFWHIFQLAWSTESDQLVYICIHFY